MYDHVVEHVSQYKDFTHVDASEFELNDFVIRKLYLDEFHAKGTHILRQR